MNSTSRFAAIAIGNGNYQYLNRLHGPETDVSTIHDLLCVDKETALIPEKNFKSLVNVPCSVARDTLIEFVAGRSAANDILLFYFSGHGVPIGNNDLGLCMVDSQVHQGLNVPISLSMIRFSELVETLAAVKVDPIVILDACYSGYAGVQMHQVFSVLNGTIQAGTGSAYALLCSSTKNEATLDLGISSSFSKVLARVAKQGLGDATNRNKGVIYLHDLFPRLRSEVEATIDIEAQLFIGKTLPEFGFVRNSQFRLRSESLTKGHKTALLGFWNGGNPRDVTVAELQKLGSTVHTTYGKLRYAPAWALIEYLDSKSRRLTERGKQFLEGNLKIPYTIVRKADSQDWEPAENTRYVGISEM